MRSVKKIIITYLLLFSGYVSAATITTDSPTTNVNISDVFTIDVIGTGFVSNVDGGGVNITYDHNVLNVLSVSIDEFVWDFGGFGINTGTIDNSAGTVDGIMVNTFKNVSGEFTVATIQLQAIAAGSSMLTLSDYVLNPWASAGSAINPDYVGGEVIVSSVPLPAAFWLFGSGLIGLIGLMKRQS